jgi:hypothetical protein
MMVAFVEGIFLAPEGGAQMKSVQAATALESCGLEGDRYCARTGHWNRFSRVCEVTFMAAEDLHNIEREIQAWVYARQPALYVASKAVRSASNVLRQSAHLSR